MARPDLRRRALSGRDRERGAALVEFALVAPMLFLIIGGVIDFSMLFNNYQALRQGVRESARSGAVMDFGNSTSCNLTGLTGSPSTDIQRLICTTKQQTGIDSSQVRVKIMFADEDLTAQQSTTFVQGYSLIVCAQAPQSSLTGMLTPHFNGRFIKSKTAIRIEQTPEFPQRDGYETPMTGSNWNWCSNPGQVSS